MATIANTPSATCAACGKLSRPKTLRYDPGTFKGYCESEFVCNDDHPNNMNNIIVRGKRIELKTLEETQTLYAEHMALQSANPDLVKDFRRLMEKPLSIRFQDADTALSIARVKNDMAFSALADAIRYLIEMGAKEYAKLHRLNDKTVQETGEARVEVPQNPTDPARSQAMTKQFKQSYGGEQIVRVEEAYREHVAAQPTPVPEPDEDEDMTF